MRFSVFLLLILLSSVTFAADRVSLVQSKIQSTLAGILDKSDYIVIVNRTEQLEDFAVSQSSTGAVKSLPGLNVGVDDKGQVVRQDADSSSYNGDVSITVLLDKAVKEETYKTIQKMIPELAGGLRDNDEVRISRAQLRQATKSSESPVTVNNITQPDKFSYSESLKFIALLMIGAGLFAWLLGRFLPSQKNEESPHRPFAHREDEKTTPAVKALENLDLTELSPEATSLYLLKCLKDNNLAPFTSWFELSPVSFQRKVFIELPAWSASYMQALIKKSSPAEDPVSPDTIYREISILEQTLKYSAEKEKYFLLWFPAQALRHVPKHVQKAVSESTRLALWFLRPELGDFARVDSLNADEISAEPSKEQYAQAYQEMNAWPSTAFTQDVRGSRDVVEAWASMINSLTEFSPIESQVQQAKEKLTAEQYQQLLSRIVTAETPLKFSTEKLKHWLLLIDPNDYYWWSSVIKNPVSWRLETVLRPMRLAMFQIAEKDKVFANWSEAEKKEAAIRILHHLKHVHLGEKTNEILAA